jgi:hypothetical protein
MVTITVDAGPGRVDPRAIQWLPEASAEVASAWRALREAVQAPPTTMDLAAGERPSADVEVLAAAVATCEYLLAARMHAAATAGCLPLGERGGVLSARGWSPALARRLARCAALAVSHPGIASAWSAGIITSEHVDPIARAADRFTGDELAAIVAELAPHWGAWSPAAIARFVSAAERLLHPPPDPSPSEIGAYETRDLAFALTADAVLVAATLPRVEGELVIAAIDALADRLRSTADHVPAGARRADALVQLVNDAHASDALPARGGLPVSLTVTLEHTAQADDVWTTSLGHGLTHPEARWAACDALVTPIMVVAHGFDLDLGNATMPERGTFPRGLQGGEARTSPTARAGATPAARIAALAATLFGTRIPLGVGRTARTANPAQRRALATRDRGCVIPGCAIPAEACQTHHLLEWAQGGGTDIDNLALLCWAHHRQVDLHMWTIEPAEPDTPVPEPDPGAPPGTPWPGNNGSPWTIRRTHRTRWRS